MIPLLAHGQSLTETAKYGVRNGMNRFEGSGKSEARVRYLDGDFQVISPGAFVRCAMTGQSIALDELKYWSVDRQEAYLDAAASLAAEMAHNPGLRRRQG